MTPKIEILPVSDSEEVRVRPIARTTQNCTEIRAILACLRRVSFAASQPVRLWARGNTLRLFRWFSVGPIPAAYDLRQLGWQLLGDSTSSGCGEAHAILGCPHGLPAPERKRLSGTSLIQRKWMMLLGVEESDERVQMLRLGFGEVLGRMNSLDELEARVLRLCDTAQALPRFRGHGALQLDLLRREAFVDGRALGLHPREFALLWRLADAPGRPVEAGELLHDVWRLKFRPETNSLAVHVSRVRGKLRLAGLGHLIETLPSGSYRLTDHDDGPAQGLAPPSPKMALDEYLRMGKNCAFATT